MPYNFQNYASIQHIRCKPTGEDQNGKPKIMILGVVKMSAEMYKAIVDLSYTMSCFRTFALEQIIVSVCQTVSIILYVYNVFNWYCSSYLYSNLVLFFYLLFP